MGEPLVRTIDVPCGQGMAFSVFMDMASWWPTERFATSVMREQTVRELQVELREGGPIVEVSSDGQTYRWGTIVTYAPPDHVKMDFHVPHPSEESPGFTTVDVHFTPIDDANTRVELTQSHWEGLGDAAEMAQGGYRHAWGVILERYRSACGA